jgi:hypothetical protein
MNRDSTILLMGRHILHHLEHLLPRFRPGEPVIRSDHNQDNVEEATTAKKSLAVGVAGNPTIPGVSTENVGTTMLGTCDLATTDKLLPAIPEVSPGENDAITMPGRSEMRLRRTAA